MDRYMNDAHSMYYNVDHSSMYGSNLSTVYADSPPPLDEDDEDHGEFVFSPKTNAVGEEVLSKIEGKMQRDVEGKARKVIVESDDKTNSAISTNKFVAFADSKNSNHCGSTSNGEQGIEFNHEVNGPACKPSKNAFLRTAGEESDDDFGDFSSSFSQSSDVHEHDELESKTEPKSGVTNGDEFGHFPGSNSVKFKENAFSNFGDKCSFSESGGNFGSGAVMESGDNVMSKAKENDQISSKDSGFAAFVGSESKCNKPDGLHPDKKIKTDETTKVSSELCVKNNVGDMSNSDDNSDDEFTSFATSGDCDFANFNDGSLEEPAELKAMDGSPDIIPLAEKNKLEGKVKWENISKMSDSDDDDFNSFEAFKDQENFETFMGDFQKGEIDSKNVKNASTFGEESCNESTLTETVKSTEILRTENKNEEHSYANSTEDDDFGDFANFSDHSFSAFSSDSGIGSDKANNAVFKSVQCENESDSLNWSESKFVPQQQKTSSNERQFSQTNDSLPSIPNSFKASSDYSAPFAKGPLQGKVGRFHTDFNAFSKNTATLQFGKKSKQQIPSSLVSLNAGFQNIFITKPCKVKGLRDVNNFEGRRIKQEMMWKSLCSNMGEGILRFLWEECMTSEKTCKALNVSRDKIMVNPSVISMSEGLEIPAFAAGLGILQPSIVPVPQTKRKSKRKEQKVPSSSVSQATVVSQTSSKFKTESIKDSNSDSTSLSDTASLDLDFFASTPSNLPGNSDQNPSNKFSNLDFSFDSFTSGQQSLFSHSQSDFGLQESHKPFQDDPLKILKKLDTTKMSSSVGNGSQVQLSPQAADMLKRLEDLSFMHSSVLMFPLLKS